MANRNTLHINAIDDFKKWLIDDGWEIQTPKGFYEVIRATKGRKTFIAFIRLKSNLQHLSTSDENASVVRAYLKDKKCRK